jgi:hypothetical protein
VELRLEHHRTIEQVGPFRGQGQCQACAAAPADHGRPPPGDLLDDGSSVPDVDPRIGNRRVGGATEAAQVVGDHSVVCREKVHDRLPDLDLHAHAMQEHERVTVTAILIGQIDTVEHESLHNVVIPL